MATIVNDTINIIGSKISDLAGQSVFNYEEDKIYNFVVSKNGYTTKSFQLGPTLSLSYTVWLTPVIQYNLTDAYSGININYYINPYLSEGGVLLLSDNFKENQTNNFTFIITSNNGDLLDYGFTLNYKTQTNTTTGVNSYGSILQNQLRIDNSSILDKVTLTYNYTSSVSGYHEFKQVFFISKNSTYGLLSNLKYEHFGLGILERLLVVIIVAGIFGGLITLFNGPVAGGFAIMFIFGYFMYNRFISVWYVALPLILIFFYILWRSD